MSAVFEAGKVVGKAFVVGTVLALLALTCAMGLMTAIGFLVFP